jgi:hypothetical protein
MKRRLIILLVFVATLSGCATNHGCMSLNAKVRHHKNKLSQEARYHKGYIWPSGNWPFEYLQ